MSNEQINNCFSFSKTKVLPGYVMPVAVIFLNGVKKTDRWTDES